MSSSYLSLSQVQPPNPTAKQTELLMHQIVQKYLDLFIDRHMNLIGKLRGAQIRAEKDGSGTVRWPFVRNDVMDPAVPQVHVEKVRKEQLRPQTARLSAKCMLGAGHLSKRSDNFLRD